MSKELATIKLDSPIDITFEEAKLGNLYTKEAYHMLKELEFKAILKRFDGEEQEDFEVKIKEIVDLAEAEDIFAKTAKKKEAEQKKAAERKNQEMAKVRPDTRQANRIKNPAENYQELRNIEPEEGETEAEIQVFDGQEYNPKLDSGSEANGILEVMTEGYGFIRSANYLPGDRDIYVSPVQIRKFCLKKGDIIGGPVRNKTQGEKFSALLFIRHVNGMLPSVAAKRKPFEDLTPIFPNERISLDETGAPVAIRIVDLLSPIGKGQRGMIVSPPKAGKTTLLKAIAKSISTRNRDMHLIVLLIDERPEEVTDIRESIEGENVEVIYLMSFQITISVYRRW